jgi:hypothetical protein
MAFYLCLVTILGEQASIEYELSVTRTSLHASCKPYATYERTVRVISCPPKLARC